jgi:hypothetical protein
MYHHLREQNFFFLLLICKQVVSPSPGGGLFGLFAQVHHQIGDFVHVVAQIVAGDVPADAPALQFQNLAKESLRIVPHIVRMRRRIRVGTLPCLGQQVPVGGFVFMFDRNQRVGADAHPTQEQSQMPTSQPRQEPGSERRMLISWLQKKMQKAKSKSRREWEEVFYYY